MLRLRIYCQDTLRITFFDLHEQKEVLIYEDQNGKLLAVLDDEWRLKAIGKISMRESILHKKLKDGMQFLLESETGNICFYVKEFKKNNLEYNAYVLDKQKIVLGRSSNCDICISSNLISKIHATIYLENNTWYLVDENSLNGCYVNNKRTKEIKITCGDTIWLGNLMLIIGNNEILIPKQISVITNLSYSLKEEFVGKQEVNFFVLQDSLQEFNASFIEVELPIKKVNVETMPAIYVLGPSITMGVSSTAMGLFSLWTFLQTNESFSTMIPSLIMAISMALATILWPLMSKKYEYRQRIQKEEHRRYMYLSYLENVKNQIENEIQSELVYRKQSYPTLKEMYSQIKKYQVLRQRQKGDIDWLCVVLGFGSQKASLQLEVPSVSSFEQDDLIDRLLDICQNNRFLQDTAFVCDLKEYKNLQITGKKKESIDFLLMILLQIVMLHSANTVKIIIIGHKQMMWEEKLFGLSHLFYGHDRLWIHDTQSYYRVESLLNEIIDNEQIKEIIVFSFDKEEYLSRLELIKSDKLRILKWNTQTYSMLGQISLYGGYLSWKDSNEKYSIQYIDSSIRRKLFLLFNSTYSFSQEKIIDFLSLWDVQSVEQLQIGTRWKHSDVSMSLKTVIGRDEHYGLVYLDAHEHAHGPHGLLAGMTGSGKSECILTYLLSLAVSYSYNDVNFLLIDFKGGTMASALEKLPHTAGIITNLDQGTLMRCLVAIESELTRRQEKLLEVGKKYHISSMDIDKYHQLKKTYSLEPMPHLFIVADEFAQLKQLFPAFLDHLRQCARIGRSLGIHLVLATQKPFGIVDEQIWSNARFHICLKVAQRTDSIDMLKKEDAIYLKHPGELYFQVGNDEVYMRAKTAWTQAPYIPSKINQIDQFTYLNDDGSIAHWNRKNNKVTKTQLEVICDAICKEAQCKKMQKLWLPLLPHNLFQESLRYHGDDLCMGLIDDVKHQQQYPFTISLKKNENFVVCGMVQSGKTLFIETLVQNCLLASSCVMYLFDFDRPVLKKYEKYHDVAYVFEKEDAHQIQSFFYMMRSIMVERRRNSQKEIILCIIHNFEVFHEIYGEWEDELLYLLREGKKYNILVCISASSIYQIPIRFHAHIENRYMLYGALEEYAYAFQLDTELIPLRQIGCGLMKQKEEIYMFQIASFQKEDWKKSDCSKTDEKYILKELPKQVSHPIYTNRLDSFIGINSVTLEDVYWKGKILFILCAFRFFDPFITLFLQSLEQNQNVHYFGKMQEFHRKPEMIETCSNYLKEKEKHIFIWHDIKKQQYDSITLQKLFHHPLHQHIFIETIFNIQNYKLNDWFQPLWMYAEVLWIGRGFQQFAYELNKQAISQKKLNENEAFYWEDEICKVVQLWEVEENG